MSKPIASRSKIASGLFWKFGERIIAQVVSFLVSLLLARLLLPEEYGIVALVLVFINIANVFVSNGLGEALVQRKDASEQDFSTMFFCSAGISILLYLILFFGAPSIAKFYDNPELVAVLRVLALQVPLSSVKTIQQAYVQRKMMFRKFFWSTLGGTLLSGIVGIALAFMGYGVWALVAQYLVNSFVDTLILFLTLDWRPHLDFNSKSAKEMMGYGWKLVLSNFINTFYVELKSLLIGKFYTEADLAAYNKGNQFPSLLITNINVSIGSVMFPAMASHGGDAKAVKNLTKKSVSITSYILVPMLAGLIATAEPLIRLLLTDKWLVCVPFLQISCFYWMFQPSQTANVQAIKAMGRSDICLKLEIVKKVIGITLLLITIPINVYAVVITNAIFAGISALLNIIPNGRLIQYGVVEQTKDAMPAVLLAILVFFSASAVRYLELSSFPTICIQVAVGAGVYFLASFIFKVKSFYFLLDQLKSHTCKM